MPKAISGDFRKSLMHDGEGSHCMWLVLSYGDKRLKDDVV